MEKPICECCSPGFLQLIQRRKEFARLSQEHELGTSGDTAARFASAREILAHAMAQLNDAVSKGTPLANVDAVVELVSVLREMKSAATAEKHIDTAESLASAYLCGIAETLIEVWKDVAGCQQEGFYIRTSAEKASLRKLDVRGNNSEDKT